MWEHSKVHLTAADRDTIARWWRIMLPAVVLVILVLIGADKAYQTLRPAAPSVQAADERSQGLRQAGFSEARSGQ